MAGMLVQLRDSFRTASQLGGGCSLHEKRRTMIIYSYHFPQKLADLEISSSALPGPIRNHSTIMYWQMTCVTGKGRYMAQVCL